MNSALAMRDQGGEEKQEKQGGLEKVREAKEPALAIRDPREVEKQGNQRQQQLC